MSEIDNICENCGENVTQDIYDCVECRNQICGMCAYICKNCAGYFCDGCYHDHKNNCN